MDNSCDDRDQRDTGFHLSSVDQIRMQQRECWNGVMDDLWVAKQRFIDVMLRPFEELLVKEVKTYNPRNVLDVGCGNDTTTLSIAGCLSTGKMCIGIDLSEQMIRNAQRNSSTVKSTCSFIAADAETYDFGDSDFDLIVSRFGVMFFADPTAAFSNLRQAASHNATLLLLVRQRPKAGDFMQRSLEIAASISPPREKEQNDGPGPFRFGDKSYVRKIVRAGGWIDIEFEEINRLCSFPLDDMRMFVENFAPIGQDPEQLDKGTREKLYGSICTAYKEFINDGKITFDAPCLLIRASSGEL